MLIMLINDDLRMLNDSQKNIMSVSFVYVDVFLWPYIALVYRQKVTIKQKYFYYLFGRLK